MNRGLCWSLSFLLKISFNNVVKSSAASTSVFTNSFVSSTKLYPVPTGLSYIIKLQYINPKTKKKRTIISWKWNHHDPFTTNNRSAFFNHVEFLGFKSVPNGPISWKFPIPTPEAPYRIKIKTKKKQKEKNDSNEFQTRLNFLECSLKFILVRNDAKWHSLVLPVTKELLAMAWRGFQLCTDFYKATRTCVLLCQTIHPKGKKKEKIE